MHVIYTYARDLSAYIEPSRVSPPPLPPPCMHTHSYNMYNTCINTNTLSQHINVDEDTKSLKGQLLAVCPSLEKLPSMDDLLAIWAGVRVRMFMHYQLSARAYFTFLKLSGSQAGSSPALDDMNVTASLRLLRLLVKYAVELKSELEKGFANTPTKPWKGKPAV